jgi:hypothetical protein
MSPPTGQEPPGSTLDDWPLFIESAMQAASRAGQRRVAGPQYPGVILWLGRAIVPVDAIAPGEAPPEWN